MTATQDIQSANDRRSGHSLQRVVRRAALNPREAKCCCACAHWHKHGDKDGQCRNPKMRHGVTYKDKNTGEETHVEWWTTGCYHSCLNWTDASTPNDKIRDPAT
jgi:hypothetical protein